MEIKKMSDRVFFYPHQPETDRPMLAYLKGERISLAVDAGNSAAHVDEFYEALKTAGLKKPDLTLITHWHWDHTFGMHHIHGLSLAHKATNELLKNEQAKLIDKAYENYMKEDNPYIAREYAFDKEIVVVPSSLQFEGTLSIDLGGMTAEISHTEAPHTKDTVLLYLPEEKILFLGDATSEDYDNNGYMDNEKLKALMGTIEKTDCRYCIVSHTEPLEKEELLEYLRSSVLM